MTLLSLKNFRLYTAFRIYGFSIKSMTDITVWQRFASRARFAGVARSALQRAIKMISAKQAKSDTCGAMVSRYRVSQRRKSCSRKYRKHHHQHITIIAIFSVIWRSENIIISYNVQL